MFQPGQKIGPYHLERPLGEGSYGVVWLAEERTGLIQRPIALKLPKDPDPDIDAIRREATTWLRAGKHPNIVQVLHADIYDGQVAIASEYIPGGSLHTWLQQAGGKAPTIDSAIEMTVGILAGLQHLHALPPKPLVHRDLKPGNVLLNGTTPLLTDFGLSRAFSSTVMTQASGTPSYMPPEAFDDRFSPQTDIWATGVTLYRMLKGELPFAQREFSALIGAILNRDPDPLPGNVPSSLAHVVFRALQKDPARRYGSAEEMREALLAAASAPIFIPSVPVVESSAARSESQWDTAPIDLARANRAPDAVSRFALPAPLPATPSPLVAQAQSTPPAHGPITITEALTAMPEPRTVGTPESITTQVDQFLRRMSRNPVTFCASLLAPIPLWSLVLPFTSLLDAKGHSDIAISLVFFTSGILSLLFARMGWHRYYQSAVDRRKKLATRFGMLGLFSGTIVPLVIVAFVIGFRNATQSPDPTESEPKDKQIRP